jgi:hypothetical protein
MGGSFLLIMINALDVPVSLALTDHFLLSFVAGWPAQKISVHLSPLHLSPLHLSPPVILKYKQGRQCQGSAPPFLDQQYHLGAVWCQRSVLASQPSKVEASLDIFKESTTVMSSLSAHNLHAANPSVRQFPAFYLCLTDALCHVLPIGSVTVKVRSAASKTDFYHKAQLTIPVDPNCQRGG